MMCKLWFVTSKKFANHCHRYTKGLKVLGRVKESFAFIFLIEKFSVLPMSTTVFPKLFEVADHNLPFELLADHKNNPRSIKDEFLLEKHKKLLFSSNRPNKWWKNPYIFFSWTRKAKFADHKWSTDRALGNTGIDRRFNMVAC